MAVHPFPIDKARAIRVPMPRITLDDRFWTSREGSPRQGRSAALLLGCAIVGGAMLAFQYAESPRPAPMPLQVVYDPGRLGAAGN